MSYILSLRKKLIPSLTIITTLLCATACTHNPVPAPVEDGWKRAKKPTPTPSRPLSTSTTSTEETEKEAREKALEDQHLFIEKVGAKGEPQGSKGQVIEKMSAQGVEQPLVVPGEHEAVKLKKPLREPEKPSTEAAENETKHALESQDSTNSVKLETTEKGKAEIVAPSAPKPAPIEDVEEGYINTKKGNSPTESQAKPLVWPVANALVISKYKENGNKGINFGGSRGTSVMAAGEGKVSYAGEGLPAYGKLVIVTHDNGLRTTYAHNSKLLVKEGDRVKAGQKIAEMGSSGTKNVMLHFEVRKNGDPVDPVNYLR